MAIPPMNLGEPDVAFRLGWVTKKQAKEAHDRASGSAGADALAILAEIAKLTGDTVQKIRRREPAPGTTAPKDLADQAAWIRANEAFDAKGAGAKEFADLRRTEAAVRQSGSAVSRLYSRALRGETIESFGGTRALHIGEASHGIEVWTLSSDAGGGTLLWIRFDTNKDGVLFEISSKAAPSAVLVSIRMEGMPPIRYFTFAIDNLRWTRSLPPDEAAARAEWTAFTKQIGGVFEAIGVKLATSERDDTSPKA